MLLRKRPLNGWARTEEKGFAPEPWAKALRRRSWAMEQDIRKVTIRNYKAQIVASDLLCTTLASEFRDESMTFEQREEIAHRWEKAKREGQSLQFMLEMLEKEEREEIDRRRAKSLTPKTALPEYGCLNLSGQEALPE